MKKTIFYTLLFSTSLGLVNSCSDRFVDTEFNQSIEQRPFQSIEELESGVNGAYVSMRHYSYLGRDLLMYAEVRGSEMYSARTTGRYTTVANLQTPMLATDQWASSTYEQIYKAVAKANISINTPEEGLLWGSSSNPATIKSKAQELKAQAYAIRALAFFDLNRLYGQKYVTGGTLGVVLPLVYDPTKKQARSSVLETENQVESDLNTAVNLFQQAQVNIPFNSSKTTLNLYSVKALQSRFYLYKGDYSKVRSLTNEIVASGKYQVVGSDALLNSFSANNSAPNSLFELAMGPLGTQGSESLQAIMSPSGYNNVRVKTTTPTLYAANDKRKQFFFTSGSSTYLSKYKNTLGEDNVKILRYEEVLLNGAEAELNGGSPAKALQYYNLLVANRGLPAATTISLADVKLERKKELIGEGFSMWDNLRWGQGVEFSSNTGAPNAANNLAPGSKYLAFPIPRFEFNVPGSPVVQNSGYDN